MITHTLYLCYFGFREPLVQTQVLPYLREIKKLPNVKVSIVTFEPNFSETWSAEQIETEKTKLADEGITWHVLPYHKSPSVPATLYDIFCGARLARKLIKTENVNVLHARVHVPALMGLIAKKLSGRKTKMIFDIRGFMPEEYTDIGHWKKDGLLYKTVKVIERNLMKNSDGFVVLTEKARDILFPESRKTGFDQAGRPVEVIPCCVDVERFENTGEKTRAAMREKLNLNGRRVITYVGSFGTWYLEDQMFDLFAAAREQDPATFALILTKNPSDEIRNKLIQRGFTEKDFLITKISPAEVPQYVCAADVALSFIKACYSKQSSSPTKVAEYLACGVPIICNPGVGDVDELIQTERIGTILDDFNTESYIKALKEIDDLYKEGNLPERCRETAKRRFDLEKIGGAKYQDLYRKLIGQQN